METISTELASYANDFTLLMTDKSFDYDKMRTVVTDIIDIIINRFNRFNDINVIDQLMTSLIDIHKVSNIETTIWHSNGQQQYPVNSCLSMLLSDTLKENYHNIVSDCKTYTGSKCSLGNKLVNGHQHVFVCSFHEFDSLNIHLVLACVYNGIYAIQNNLNVTNSMIFGLYHDIGKMSTIQTYEMAKKLYVGFPAHAEVGSMMFQMHWSNKMTSVISMNDFMAVSTAILRHMCGYHGNETDETLYKRNLLLLDKISVRNLLCVNRIGDFYGKLTTEQECSDDHFMIEQKKFENAMNRNNTFDLFDTLSQFYSNGQMINCNKIVVFVIGSSGAGKTYFTSLMNERYPKLCGFVSRDRAIAKVCVGVDKRFEGDAYIKMYKIYVAYKELYRSFDESIKGQQKNDELIQKVKTAKSEWNNFIVANNLDYALLDVSEDIKSFNIVESVQVECNKQINHILHDKMSRFIVLDSVTNCFPTFIEQYMPAIFKKLFRVHVHVQSYLEKTNSTVTDSIDNQLKISSSYGIYNPIMSNGFDKHRKFFASLSSSNTMDGYLPADCFSTKYRPHLVAGVCTRIDDCVIGYEQTFDMLDNLIRHDEKTDYSIIESDIFGVENETKDMNIIQFYSHLMNKFNNNQTMIREYLSSLGFTMSSYLMTKNAEKMNALYVKFAKLSNEWYENGIITSNVTVEDFKNNVNNCMQHYMHSIVMFKYLDHCQGERFWQNKWATEMRGTVMFVNPETFVPVVLSFKLNRGAEVLTRMTIDKKIETQDVVGSANDILDDEQRDTCQRICDNMPMDAFLTSKGDGSLLIINIYSGNSMKIMYPIVSHFGSEYVCMWANTSMKYFDNKYMIVPSTQGTVIEGGFMSDYMVTSMLCSTGIATRNELSKFTNCTDAFDYYHSLFYNKLDNLIQCIDMSVSQTITLNFEAMCAGRRGGFNDKVHIELAVEYENDRLIFLGLSYTDRLFYVPHMLVSSSPVFEKQQFPFEEPLWWHIENGEQINNMIEVLNNVILNKMTKKEYLTMFPPKNVDVDNFNDAIIDYEGWIIMKKAVFESTDSNKNIIVEKLNYPITIYSKAKTEAYYMAHKFRTKNIDYLLNLARAVGDNRFPLCTKILSLHTVTPMNVRFLSIKNELVKFLDFSPNGTLMNILIEYDKTIVSNGKKSMIKGFDKRPFAIQCRMLFSIRNEFVENTIKDIFMSSFPEICHHDNMTSISMNVTRSLELWHVSDETLSNLTIESPILNDLLNNMF